MHVFTLFMSDILCKASIMHIPHIPENISFPRADCLLTQPSPLLYFKFEIATLIRRVTKLSLLKRIEPVFTYHARLRSVLILPTPPETHPPIFTDAESMGISF